LNRTFAHAETACQLGDTLALVISLTYKLVVSQTGGRPAPSRLLVVPAARQGTLQAGREEVAAFVAVFEVVGQRISAGLDIDLIPGGG